MRWWFMMVHACLLTFIQEHKQPINQSYFRNFVINISVFLFELLTLQLLHRKVHFEACGMFPLDFTVCGETLFWKFYNCSIINNLSPCLKCQIFLTLTTLWILWSWIVKRTRAIYRALQANCSTMPTSYRGRIICVALKSVLCVVSFHIHLRHH
jgi:hypothetical protein